jgi:superfamily II DNA or RNA helicase
MNVKFIQNDEFIEISNVADKAELDAITNVVSAIPMYWQNKRMIQGNPIVYFKDFKYIPAGLWNRIHNMGKNGHIVKFDNFIKMDNAITKEWIDEYIENCGYKFNLAPHQLAAVYTALKFKNTCCTIGTSGGKTFIAFTIAAIYLASNKFRSDKKYLVIVPSQLLCMQGHSDFEEYQERLDEKQVKSHMIFSGAKNKYTLAESNVVFATYQSLLNMMVLDDFFKQFEWVFLDEAHKAVDSVTTILSMLKHVKAKNAFSGSLPPSHTVEMLKLETFVGPYLYEFKTAKLRDAGFTADFEIIPITIRHSAESTRNYFTAVNYEMGLRAEYAKLNDIVDLATNNKLLIVDSGTQSLTQDAIFAGVKNNKLQYILRTDYMLLLARREELYKLKAHKDFNRRLYEEEYLFSSQKRLNTIASIIKGLDKNSVTLARRKREVMGIYEAAKVLAPNKEVHLIMGGVNNVQKNDIINIIKHDDDFSRHALIGNVDMIGTGISEKKIFYGMLIGIGKSVYNAIQTIGRFIRKHEAKEKAIILDIRDEFVCDVKHTPTHVKTTYSINHSLARYQIYADENYRILHDRHKTIDI